MSYASFCREITQLTVLLKPVTYNSLFLRFQIRNVCTIIHCGHAVVQLTVLIRHRSDVADIASDCVMGTHHGEDITLQSADPTAVWHAVHHKVLCVVFRAFHTVIASVVFIGGGGLLMYKLLHKQLPTAVFLH